MILQELQLKETTIHNKNHSSIKGHNKLTVYDPNDIARTTIKETTLFESNGGNIRPTRPEEAPNYNIEPAKPTIKGNNN